ncbi:DegT/DnrJ/EryC1/StrS family aminotransferase [Algimonas porphyrae]|uniref:Aminotransferase DegT n=1 Tax=Algimonas porphyrae TaxID=1128113 RepID=A0ABQ5V4V7_9PROT|nr:DegT/DnrJ/EryC1/StrS aminotransferase family protein [Algimonas porphyrae]GLQ21984.1 aminotransferase DegT [Algimonas porphyrae]
MQFIDLHAQQARLKDEIEGGIADVLKSGRYILGPQVTEFEGKLAAFGEAKHAVGCANGTDAILLPLLAWSVGPGDAVFCPSFTYCATAEVVALAGATPVFVDIDRDTYNMDVNSLKQAVTDVKAKGELTPKAVIAVDLFGQSADYEALAPVVRENGMKFISDSAQGFGTTLTGKHPLHWTDCQTTSFFPAKPLGCYGDGGATLTNDDDLEFKLRSLRVHGKGKDKYDNVRIGMNSRLDTLQAAILLPKLAVFADEIEKRNVVAARYKDGLSGVADRIPVVMDGVVSTWAQYTIEVPDPFAFADALKAEGVPTARYYPKPVHIQTAYEHYPVAGNGLPNTMDCIDHIISLPMHPYLSEEDQAKVISAAKTALA